MIDSKPIIVVEPGAAEAAAQVAAGYSVMACPANGNADLSEFFGRKVILWPNSSPESRESFRKLGELLSEKCEEIKLILPNGKGHGWNIASAVAEGMSWPQIAAWAKGSMIIFGKGEFPRMPIEMMESADPTPASVHALWEQLGLAMSANDSPVINVDNVVRILSGWDAFKQMIWFDQFYNRYLTTWNAKRPREWHDIDDINLTVLLQREFGFLRIRQDAVSAAVRCRAHQCVKNEPKDWLRALPWDGKPRIDKFFAHYLGAFPNGYTFAVSRNFWIGMVARIYNPGCQLDNMVILEGKQGIFKSKALEAIGGKWYMEASEEITSKDFFVALQGKLIVEIADLDSFSRADTNRIKKVITCRTDRFRMPYGRATQDHPRQSIFVGTTNEQHYLKDSTGARRFWPITCGHIDLEGIRREREQLFAEAVARYLDNEDWYQVPKDATLAEQEDRRQYDEWENIVGLYVRESCKSEVTIQDVAAQVGVDKGKLDVNIQRRLGSILRRMGWLSRVVRRDSVTQRIWVLNSHNQESSIESQGLLPSVSHSRSLPETA